MNLTGVPNITRTNSASVRLIVFQNKNTQKNCCKSLVCAVISDHLNATKRGYPLLTLPTADYIKSGFRFLDIATQLTPEWLIYRVNLILSSFLFRNTVRTVSRSYGLANNKFNAWETRKDKKSRFRPTIPRFFFFFKIPLIPIGRMKRLTKCQPAWSRLPLPYRLQASSYSFKNMSRG